MIFFFLFSLDGSLLSVPLSFVTPEVAKYVPNAADLYLMQLEDTKYRKHICYRGSDPIRSRSSHTNYARNLHPLTESLCH